MLDAVVKSAIFPAGRRKGRRIAVEEMNGEKNAALVHARFVFPRSIISDFFSHEMKNKHGPLARLVSATLSGEMQPGN